MKSLFSYLFIHGADCHVHLFDAHGSITPIKLGGIGFPDISVREEPELYDLEGLRKMYAENISKFPGYHILATALNPEDAITILEEFGLKGFGEIKCYDHKRVGDQRIKLPYKSKEYWQPLFDYAHTHKLPVWIHWSILSEQDYEALYDIISSYPDAKFVLCHCGIDSDDALKREGVTAEQAFWCCTRLVKALPNAYADISWAASAFLLKNPQYRLPELKYVIGSDVFPALYRGEAKDSIPEFEDYDSAVQCYKKICNQLKGSANIIRLI